MFWENYDTSRSLDANQSEFTAKNARIPSLFYARVVHFCASRDAPTNGATVMRTASRIKCLSCRSPGVLLSSRMFVLTAQRLAALRSAVRLNGQKASRLRAHPTATHDVELIGGRG